MKEFIASLLKPFANLCFRLANSVSPTVAIVIYIVLLAALALWVLTLKKERPQPAAGKITILKDLRLWAVLILLIQIAIYIILR